MGAAEWTGYSSGTANSATPSAYSSYYHHHSHHNHHHHHHAQMSALPPPPPPPPAAIPPASNSSVALTHPYGGMSGYDTSAAALAADHANFHLPTVLSDMQPFCASTDYHAAASAAMVAPHAQAPICSPNYGSTKSDIDSLNAGYPSYNNWSNGYNNYQQAQYPPPAPTMVLCPQLYSVNQNQIHLHVHHTSDKIDQYLGASENALTISSIGSNRNSVEIGIGTSDHEQSVAAGMLHGNLDVGDGNAVGDMSAGTTLNNIDQQNQNHIHHSQQHHQISQQQHESAQQHHHQQQQQQQQQQQHHHQQQQLIEATQATEVAEHVQHTQTRDDEVVGDLGAVWRPY